MVLRYTRELSLTRGLEKFTSSDYGVASIAPSKINNTHKDYFFVALFFPNLRVDFFLFL